MLVLSRTIGEYNLFKLMEFLKPRFFEITGALFVSFSLVYLLSLVSYHPLNNFDLLFEHFSLIGFLSKIGSFAATSMLESFGLVAYLLFLYLFVWGVFF